MTKSEGTFPVISAHAVLESGCPFTTRWKAEEFFRSLVGAPSPTRGVPRAERDPVPNRGPGRARAGTPGRAQMPDRPLPPALAPWHLSARSAPSSVSAEPFRKETEVPGPRWMFHQVSRLAEACLDGRADGIGPGRMQRSGMASAEGRTVRSGEAQPDVERAGAFPPSATAMTVRAASRPRPVAGKAGSGAVRNPDPTALPRIVSFRIRHGREEASPGRAGFAASSALAKAMWSRKFNPVSGRDGPESRPIRGPEATRRTGRRGGAGSRTTIDSPPGQPAQGRTSP